MACSAPRWRPDCCNIKSVVTYRNCDIDVSRAQRDRELVTASLVVQVSQLTEVDAPVDELGAESGQCLGPYGLCMG